MIKPFTQFLQKKLPPKDQTVTEGVDLEASKKVATNNGAVTEASGKDYKLFIQIVYIMIDFFNFTFYASFFRKFFFKIVRVVTFKLLV